MDRPFVNTLQLASPELSRLLEVLASDETRRAPERVPYAMADLPLMLDRLHGGRMSRVLAHGVRLWPDGIELLHRAYLLPGTTCTVGLRARPGAEASEFVSGHVLDSEPVLGTIHLVTVRFDETQDTQSLVSAD